ncbi:hypothetical protein [Ignavibacterium sp.]|uniref:hypothetical protein n=1 Tax=Ignavibacterium sp. TaxID=2651167 RepID=UPI00307DA4CC
MDRLEAKEYIQAAALGCLDRKDFDELKELLEFDSELQFELAAYQTLCAMIPFSMDIINPGEIVKDNVALRLIKIEEELRAKREAELKSQLPEAIVEDTSDIIQELQANETEIKDLSQELNEGSEIQSLEEQVEIETPEVFEAPIPESYLAEDVTKTEDIPDIPIEEEIISDEIFENEIAEPQTTQIENNIAEETPENNILSEIQKDDSTEHIEDIKYDEPKPSEIKPVVESFSGQVRVEQPTFSESRFSDITSRTVAEKLQKSFQMDIEAIKRAVEKSEAKFFKGIITLIIICAVLLALSIFIYFKFTADIKKLELELEKIKKGNPVGIKYEPQKDYSSLL